MKTGICPRAGLTEPFGDAALAFLRTRAASTNLLVALCANGARPWSGLSDLADIA